MSTSVAAQTLLHEEVAIYLTTTHQVKDFMQLELIMIIYHGDL